MTLLLQPGTETVVVFGDIQCSKQYRQFDLCDQAPGPIIYSRFTYNGVLVDNSHMPYPKELGVVGLLRCDVVPVDHNGRFATRINGIIGGKPNMPIYVQFDEQLNQFTTVSDPTDKFVAWWKDTCYGLGSTKQDSTARVMLAHMDPRYKTPHARSLAFTNPR